MRQIVKQTWSMNQVPGFPCLRIGDSQTTIPKVCTRGYECWHCSFDQWLDEMEGSLQSEQPREATTVVFASAA
jgi:hypothetical protein